MRPDLSALRVSQVGIALFVISVIAGFALSALLHSGAPLPVCILIGLYFLFAIRMADQWEKVAVLRFGKFTGLRGPGLFHIIPVVDTLSRYVDQRVRVANVSAESTLTRDTVPVNVDTIIFWMVWNAEKSILEVQDYIEAIQLSAQTRCGNRSGGTNCTRWWQAGDDGAGTQRILDEDDTVGITVQSVEVRDVQIPLGLQDAMSRERRRTASGERASSWGRARRDRRSSGRRR